MAGHMSHAFRSVAISLVLTVALAAVGACSGSATTPTPSTPSAAPAGSAVPSAAPSTGVTSPSSAPASLAAISLPAAITQAGYINVATYPGHPPNNFLAPDGTTVIGVDASIRDVLAKELGVQFQIQKYSSFAGLIPALLSSRVDMIMSGMTDTKVREQQVNFVDYLDVGSSILTQAGNPEHITGSDSLCGLEIAATAGTTAIAEMQSQSTQCTTAGKKAVNVVQFPSNTEAVLQVTDGRAAATITDFPVATYEAQHSGGKLQVAGQPFNVSPYGIAVRKDETQLQNALQAAVQQAINDGSLKAALQQWQVSSAVPATCTINGATH